MFDADPFEQTFTMWTLVELVEAATATGERPTARSPRSSGAHPSPGVPARIGHSELKKRRLRALLDDDSPLNPSTGIDRAIGHTRMRVEVAAHPPDVRRGAATRGSGTRHEARSSAMPTRCSWQCEPTDSPSVQARSWQPPASASACRTSSGCTSSRHRRRRLPDWPVTDRRTTRSVPSCSSAHARSMAPSQGVQQARHLLPPRAGRRAALH